MKKVLARLQKQLTDGKISAADYKEQLAELLEDGAVTQEEHDEAAGFEPEGEQPEFTQSEVNNMIAKETSKRLRNVLKQAGIEVNVPNKDLSAKLVELLTESGGEGANVDKNDPEYKKLAAKAARVDTLEQQLKDSALELSLVKAAGTYKPHNVAQVVRALKADYADLLDYDDESGRVTPESMKIAMKKLTKEEPNLFTSSTGDDQGEDGEQGQGQAGSGSQYGRTPSRNGREQSQGSTTKAEDAIREALGRKQ